MKLLEIITISTITAFLVMLFMWKINMLLGGKITKWLKNKIKRRDRK